MSNASHPLDLAAVRAKLASATGPAFWRSLEEVADTPEFQQLVADEFPHRQIPKDAPNRRQWLAWMGAALGMAGMTACTKQPTERIVPYVNKPEELIPGRPLYFSTAMPFHGGAIGVVVESQMGRPTKVEGNPAHPESLGAANAFAQASIYDLYDPDRSQAVLYGDRISSWDQFVRLMEPERRRLHDGAGQGFAVLTRAVNSPVLADQIVQLQALYPQISWHQYEPLQDDNRAAGLQHALGVPATPIYDFSKADLIVSLDCDFLFGTAGHLAHARQFADRRQAERQTQPPRLYVAEPFPSLAGSMADHRIPLRASLLPALAKAIASRLQGSRTTVESVPDRWLAALTQDLQKYSNTSVILGGPSLPPEVHALICQLNHQLGSTVVRYAAPAESSPIRHGDSLRDLTERMKAGRVHTLVMLDVNPAFDAPADLGFAESIAKVPLRVHLGSHVDETAFLSHWHINAAHYLESWGDTRAYDGTVALQQPLIAPLYGGRGPLEVLAAFTPVPEQQAYKILQTYWSKRQKLDGQAFHDWWETALNNGVVENTASTAVTATPSAIGADAIAPPAASAQGVELIFRPSYTLWDGRFSNNAFLLELPDPITKLVWDNAACISPALAQRLQLHNEDLIDLRVRGRSVRAAVWVVPGQADGTMVVSLGWGRTQGGHSLQGAGFDAQALRTSDHMWVAPGLEIAKVDQTFRLACFQTHHSMEGRDPVRVASYAAYRQHPEKLQQEDKVEAPKTTLFPLYEYKDYAWGMSIDLNACIGCNACIVACQAENNIAVVGKQESMVHREMHWLRVDLYHSGSADNPRMYWQPVPCMHCEQAPCELVCPVAATVHSGEGLNQMVYNRCVGTRYCSNNCPYKVRRFNFKLYQDWETKSLESMRNPDVTVRSRGVMEKCTYCVQRIQEAKIDSEREGRRVQDGEIVTACQQTCPTGAIVFGDINDKGSLVYRRKQQWRDYALLAELDTKPRTTYMNRLENRNREADQQG